MFETRTPIASLKSKIGETVRIAGWVDTRRDHGKLIFLDIRDGSGVIQAVILPNVPEAQSTGSQLRGEWVILVEGIVNTRPEKMVNPNVLNGNIELEVRSIEIISKAEELPFELGTGVNIDTHLDYLPFTLRTERSRDIFSLQATIIEEFRNALRRERFIEFQAPSLVGGDAEGGAAAFTVDYYYDKKAFLATSPQFYKQIMVGVFERAFSTPKVFRGEKHATTRHLSEYSSLDFEMGFIDDHNDVMRVLEKVIHSIVERTKEKHGDILTRFAVETPLLPEKIPTLKLVEAQKILEEKLGEKALGEPDLEPEHERKLCEWARNELSSDFIFVTHYPVSKRPFYTYEDEEDPGYTKSFDLLFRGLEITTGGQRIHNHDTLIAKMQGKGLDPKQFSYYLQAFKYGMPPHGGSATGLERLTARMLLLPNVKEAALFPRDLNRIDKLLSED